MSGHHGTPIWQSLLYPTGCSLPNGHRLRAQRRQPHTSSFHPFGFLGCDRIMDNRWEPINNICAHYFFMHRRDNNSPLAKRDNNSQTPLTKVSHITISVHHYYLLPYKPPLELILKCVWKIPTGRKPKFTRAASLLVDSLHMYWKHIHTRDEMNKSIHSPRNSCTIGITLYA